MKYVYGPVPSRRLGQSLGIDTIPLKTCNWNCVYCQLGRSLPVTNERKEYYPREEILAEVRQALQSHEPGEIDWVTFVGSGEPTLHSDIGWLIRQVKASTELPVAVITNGALLYRPEVRQELMAADAVMPTLDAGAPDLYRRINRPHSEVTFERQKYYMRSPEGILFLTAGKIGEQGPGAGCDGPVAKIARDLRLNDLGEHPVTLVDFKAGFEDSARGAVISLDWAVVVVDPTQAAIKMAADMKAMVREIKAGTPPATQHLEFPELAELARRLFREARIKDVHFVLNKVADEETETYIRQELAEEGIEPLGVIRRDASISRAWLQGEAIAENGVDDDADQIIEALEAGQRARTLAPA